MRNSTSYIAAAEFVPNILYYCLLQFKSAEVLVTHKMETIKKTASCCYLIFCHPNPTPKPYMHTLTFYTSPRQITDKWQMTGPSDCFMPIHVLFQ